MNNSRGGGGGDDDEDETCKLLTDISASEVQYQLRMPDDAYSIGRGISKLYRHRKF